MRHITPFYLKEDLLGINVLAIREVNRNLDITPVDRAPQFVTGLMNLRGQIVTVLDLGIRLGIGARTITQDSCCIVLKTNDELQQLRAMEMDIEDTSPNIVGLLVDRVSDIVGVEEKEIEPAPANVGAIDVKFITGIVKLSDGLLIVLNLANVITIDR